jgi:hypothetical protein
MSDQAYMNSNDNNNNNNNNSSYMSSSNMTNSHLTTGTRSMMNSQMTYSRGLSDSRNSTLQDTDQSAMYFSTYDRNRNSNMTDSFTSDAGDDGKFLEVKVTFNFHNIYHCLYIDILLVCIYLAIPLRNKNLTESV